MHYSAFSCAWSTDLCIKMHNGARSVATPILLYRLGRTEPKGDGRLSKVMVRAEGFEPPQPFGHKILSLARLPVPPRPQPNYNIPIFEGQSPPHFYRRP